MNRPTSDGVHGPRNPARLSGRAIKVEGVVFVLVGFASALVVELLTVEHVIAAATRESVSRGSVSFSLVGAVMYVIGWTKNRRTGP